MKWTSTFVFFSALAIGFFALNASSASAANVQFDAVALETSGVMAVSQLESDILLVGRDKFDRRDFKGFDRDNFKRFDKDDFRKLDRDNFKRFDRDNLRKFDRFR